MGGARLLLARAESACGRTDGGAAVCGCPAVTCVGAARGARHRAVHGRCDRFDRVWRARAAGRWKRRTRARSRVRHRGRHQVERWTESAVGARWRADASATRGREAGRSESGLDGARCHDVLAGVAAVSRVSAREAVRGREDGTTRRASGRRRTQEGERAADLGEGGAMDRARRQVAARATRARRVVRRLVGAAAGR
jgi:hypothetical protein